MRPKFRVFSKFGHKPRGSERSGGLPSEIEKRCQLTTSTLAAPGSSILGWEPFVPDSARGYHATRVGPSRVPATKPDHSQR